MRDGPHVAPRNPPGLSSSLGPLDLPPLAAQAAVDRAVVASAVGGPAAWRSETQDLITPDLTFTARESA
jgi:hypothetical protein